MVPNAQAQRRVLPNPEAGFHGTQGLLPARRMQYCDINRSFLKFERR